MNQPNQNQMGPGRNPNPGPPPRRPWWGNLLLWLILALIVIPWIVLFVYQPNSNGSSQSNEPVTYSTFVQQVDKSNVQSVTINGYSVTGVFKSAVPASSGNTTSTHFATTVPQFGNSNLISLLQQHGAAINVQQPNSGNGAIWAAIASYAIPIILLGLLFWWLSRRATAAQSGIFSFGQSRARLYSGGKTQTTFKDVAGVDEAKADLVEIVDYLKSPGRYQRLGGKIPKGVLLVGPPGTGKTLLAKAVAGEADVPFFSMSGSEFVEMLVGVGASRVRDLFDKAKKSSPCIIFIDELDAVGRQRGAGLGGGNDEREQTLNQILVEMDGFDSRQAIVVLAATNRPDVLDPALMRPGRFDRQVVVDRPDRIGREAILRVHTRTVPLAPDVDLGVIARSTPGMVGADLANLVNEAALTAARRNLNQVNQTCFEEAMDRIMMGAQRPLLLNPDERKVIAYHEGGHAVVSLLAPNGDPVHKVTIVPRGQALGVTQIMPADDRHNYPRNYLLTRIAVGLGGRVAEEIAVGEITTGAENDLQNVTRLAREMVTRWGMSSRIGTVFLGGEREVFVGREVGLGQQHEYSEQMAALIDEEVQRIISERYSYVQNLLSENRDKLERLAQALLEHESVDEKQLHTIVFSDSLDGTGGGPAAKESRDQSQAGAAKW
jgi:cell division protease FtsH